MHSSRQRLRSKPPRRPSSPVIAASNTGLLLLLLCASASESAGKPVSAGSGSADQPKDAHADRQHEQPQPQPHLQQHSALGDLGSKAIGLLDPRSWDVIAPCVVPEPKTLDEAADGAGHHKTGTERSSASFNACPSDLHHSRYSPPAAVPLGPPLDILRGAVAVLIRRLRSLRGAMHSAEEAATHALQDLSDDMRDLAAWEENPWVRQEVQKLQKEHEDLHLDQQQEEQRQWLDTDLHTLEHLGKAAAARGEDEKQSPTQPQPQQFQSPSCPGEALGSCQAVTRTNLAAVAGVDKHVRALVAELRGLTSALEYLTQPEADLSSPKLLQPVADALTASQRHMEYLALTLEFGEPAEVGDLMPADDDAEGTGSHGAGDKRAPAAVTATISRWLEAVIERASEELAAAEDLVGAALGYGEHGAAVTAHDIVAGAAGHVHDALLLLYDAASPPPPQFAAAAAAGTAAAAAGARVASLADALSLRFKVSPPTHHHHDPTPAHKGQALPSNASVQDAAGGGQTELREADQMEGYCLADMRVPTSGIPPHPHLPTLSDLPEDAESARLVLMSLPHGTLAFVSRKALAEARSWALRLRNHAAFAEPAQRLKGAREGVAVAAGLDLLRDMLANRSARRKTIMSHIEDAAESVEALHAFVEQAVAVTDGNNEPGAEAQKQLQGGASTSIDHARREVVGVLIQVREALRQAEAFLAGLPLEPSRDTAFMSRSSQEVREAAASPPSPRRAGTGAVTWLQGLIRRPFIQDAWARAADFAGMLGLLRDRGQRGAQGAVTGGKGREKKSGSRVGSSTWFGFGRPAAAAELPAATPLGAGDDCWAFSEVQSAEQVEDCALYVAWPAGRDAGDRVIRYSPSPPMLPWNDAVRKAMADMVFALAGARESVVRAVKRRPIALAPASPPGFPMPPAPPRQKDVANPSAAGLPSELPIVITEDHSAPGTAPHGVYNGPTWGGVSSIVSILRTPFKALQARLSGGGDIGGRRRNTASGNVADDGAAVANSSMDNNTTDTEMDLDEQLKRMWCLAVRKLEQATSHFNQAQRLLRSTGAPPRHLPQLTRTASRAAHFERDLNVPAALTAALAENAELHPDRPPASLTVKPLLRPSHPILHPSNASIGSGPEQDAAAAQAEVADAVATEVVEVLQAAKAVQAEVARYLDTAARELGVPCFLQLELHESVVSPGAGPAAEAQHPPHGLHAARLTAQRQAQSMGGSVEGLGHVAQEAVEAGAGGVRRAAAATKDGLASVTHSLHHSGAALQHTLVHGATALGSAAVGAADMIRAARACAGDTAAAAAAGSAAVGAKVAREAATWTHDAGAALAAGAKGATGALGHYTEAALAVAENVQHEAAQTAADMAVRIGAAADAASHASLEGAAATLEALKQTRKVVTGAGHVAVEVLAHGAEQAVTAVAAAPRAGVDGAGAAASAAVELSRRAAAELHATGKQVASKAAAAAYAALHAAGRTGLRVASIVHGAAISAASGWRIGVRKLRSGGSALWTSLIRNVGMSWPGPSEVDNTHVAAGVNLSGAFSLLTRLVHLLARTERRSAAATGSLFADMSQGLRGPYHPAARFATGIARNAPLDIVIDEGRKISRGAQRVGGEMEVMKGAARDAMANSRYCDVTTSAGVGTAIANPVQPGCEAIRAIGAAGACTTVNARDAMECVLHAGADTAACWMAAASEVGCDVHAHMQRASEAVETVAKRAATAAHDTASATVHRVVDITSGAVDKAAMAAHHVADVATAAERAAKCTMEAAVHRGRFAAEVAGVVAAAAARDAGSALSHTVQASRHAVEHVGKMVREAAQGAAQKAAGGAEEAGHVVAGTATEAANVVADAATAIQGAITHAARAAADATHQVKSAAKAAAEEKIAGAMEGVVRAEGRAVEGLRQAGATFEAAINASVAAAVEAGAEVGHAVTGCAHVVGDAALGAGQSAVAAIRAAAKLRNAVERRKRGIAEGNYKADQHGNGNTTSQIRSNGSASAEINRELPLGQKSTPFMSGFQRVDVLIKQIISPVGDVQSETASPSAGNATLAGASGTGTACAGGITT